MVCDIKLFEGQKESERKRQVDEALDRLERALGDGTARVVVGPNGEVAFAGWSDEDRSGVTDNCAYRKLRARGSWALRQAEARAEGLAGRKIDQNKVGAGVHSHDGGRTWHKGH